MKLQEIFNAVIDGGFYQNYGTEERPPHVSRYMCHAVNYAETEGIISAQDAIKAHKAIQRLLDKTGSATLASHLQRTTGVDHHQSCEAFPPEVWERLLAVYRNWAKRLKFEGERPC